MGVESESEPLKPQEIPMEWYFGGGTKQFGIKIVTTSDTFLSLGDRKVGKYWDEWKHYWEKEVNDSRHEKDNPFLATNISHAESIIFEVTGFSPQQIWDKHAQLQDKYEGKFDAPFPFELY